MRTPYARSALVVAVVALCLTLLSYLVAKSVSSPPRAQPGEARRFAPKGSATSDSMGASPRLGGTLRLAVSTEPPSFDPLQLPSHDAATLAFLIFDTLHEHDGSGNYSPVLTENLPEVSPDHMTYTFRLRRGVRFSNGRGLTADDVVFSFERGCDPTTGASLSSFYRNIAGSDAFGAARVKEAESRGIDSGPDPDRPRVEPVRVTGLTSPDRYTFQLRLDSPDLTTMGFVAGIGILPREEFYRPGRPFGSHPLGTGPFALVEWRRGVRLRFERNPFYARADRAYIDRVDVLANIDITTQALMFDRGETDLLTFFADADAWRWRKNPVMRDSLIVVRGAFPSYITLNCELPPFTNRLVRQALNYAVDKEALVRRLMDRAVPAKGPLPPFARGYNPRLTGYPFDRAKARALLAEAGFPSGFDTVLWAEPGDKIALSVQEDLRAIGVRAELREATWVTLMESMGRRRTVPMGSISGPPSDEPKETLDFLLNGDTITERWSANMAFYSNPEVQRLFRQAGRETNEDRRLATYQRIEEMIVADAPWLFLCHGNFEMIRQPRLKGARILPVWPSVRLEHAWIEE